MHTRLVIAGQLIYALGSGGGCLADSEALNDDPLARELFGVERFADQSQVGEWLRGQTPGSLVALRQVLRELVPWVWQETVPERWWHAGQREVFFADTQLEVCGQPFAAAALGGPAADRQSPGWACRRARSTPGRCSSVTVPCGKAPQRTALSEPATRRFAKLSTIVTIEGMYLLSFRDLTDGVQRATSALVINRFRNPKTL